MLFSMQKGRKTLLHNFRRCEVSPPRNHKSTFAPHSKRKRRLRRCEIDFPQNQILILFSMKRKEERFAWLAKAWDQLLSDSDIAVIFTYKKRKRKNNFPKPKKMQNRTFTILDIYFVLQGKKPSVLHGFRR